MEKRIELKDSGVFFNEEAHEYWLGDKQLSGITGILHRQLFPDEFDGISEAILNAASEYGTDVHASIENFDKNWINDGTQETVDYIQICRDYGLTHEASEYNVTDGKDWSSNIDKVYRVSEDTFSLGDIKTYGQMTADKLQKARWQLSVYAYLFELQNKKAKVDKLFVIHLRNKMKQDGTFDHISEIIFLSRIPSDICKELLDTDLRGEQFKDPFAIPKEWMEQENTIRELIETKKSAEEQLNIIKSKLLSDMEEKDVKSWVTETMRITRRPPTTRSSFDLKAFKADNPDLDLSAYLKTSNVAGSLNIAV
jgi:hypothetical protein